LPAFLINMNTHSVPRSFANVSSGSVTATVWIDAPPERVFHALTSDEVTQWWGGAAYRISRWSATLETDGAWRAEGVRKDGSEFILSGVFTAVEPPHRLAMTWECIGTHLPSTTVQYRLEAFRGGTKLKVNQSGFCRGTSAFPGNTVGWEMALAWLTDYASDQVGEMG
jgi:uncharacterized protein YndB with AHSA1/START domain